MRQWIYGVVLAIGLGGVAHAACPVTGLQGQGFDGNGGACVTTTPAATTPTISTSAVVGTTSAQLFAVAAITSSATVCTLPNSIANVWLNITGGAAVVGAGLPVFANGGCSPVSSKLQVNAVSDNGQTTVTLAGG